MATWVTHLMIADGVVKQIPYLCRHEFFVGNIAPDCNVENEDWTSFTPSRQVTHWMENERKTAADCDRFLHEYVEKKENLDIKEKSFLLGYYAHLITDAEFQRFIRDEDRVKTCWDRVKQDPELSQQALRVEETWDSVKKLISGRERMKDIYSIEAEYLETHPESGYITDIVCLQEFPDYVDYFPKGAIVRKVKVIGYMPEKEVSQYPYIAMSKEEYHYFVKRTTELVIKALESYRNNHNSWKME